MSTFYKTNNNIKPYVDWATGHVFDNPHSITMHKKSQLLITDIWNRLWHEAELSLDTAVWLNQKLKVKIEIDMDYNNDETHKSFKLISAAKGWANSLGYKVNIKPQIQVATRAADYNCK